MCCGEGGGRERGRGGADTLEVWGGGGGGASNFVSVIY